MRSLINMKRMLPFILALSAFSVSSYSQNSQNAPKVTAAYLNENQAGDWAILSESNGKYSGNANSRVFPSGNGYVVFSTVDSLFIEGDGNLTLKENSGVLMRNVEVSNFPKPVNNSKNDGVHPYALSLPRPVSLVMDSTRTSWSLSLPHDKEMTIYRDWLHRDPTVKVFFERADSSSLNYSVFLDDSLHVVKKKGFKLSSIQVAKSDLPTERLVRIDSVQVDRKSVPMSEKDDFFVNKIIKLSPNLEIVGDHTIDLFFTYLNYDLQEQPVTLSYNVQLDPALIPHPGPGHHLGTILSAILLALTLLAAAVLILCSPRKNKSGAGQQEENKNRSVEDSDKQRITKFFDSVTEALGEKPADETYSDFVIGRIRKLQSTIRDLKAERGKFEKTIEQFFGPVPEGKTPDQFLSKEIEDLQALPAFVCRAIGVPGDNETHASLIQKKLDDLRKSKEDLRKSEEELQACKDAVNQKLLEQKEQITAFYEKIIANYKEQAEALSDNSMKDRKRFLSALARHFSKMKLQYARFTRQAKAKRFGEHARRIGIPFMSYVEHLESVCANVKVEDTIPDVVATLQQTLLKTLNDHSSWLNAILRLETYGRTEALRRPMLEDGLDLTALSELYYAVQGLLGCADVELQPLPELFVDTTDLDNYQLDNMDIVISSLFDYESQVHESAIIDLIKAGYVVAGEPTKSTIAFYSKPQA